ncbi:MAG TPA: hypothetical protein VNH39_11570 [Steroidobacteraceae bacterium]|nr:hypothetical protein [Steroidobacteraceae bacterium]
MARSMPVTPRRVRRSAHWPAPTAAARQDYWDEFGNDADSQPHNTLFFASGINGGADGVYGRIDLTTP